MPSPQEREDALFRAAVELPAGEARQSFLDHACAGDVALRARVGVRLAQSSQPNAPSDPAAPETSLRTNALHESSAVHDGLTASIASDGVSPSALESEFTDGKDEALGTQISHYKLVERVGEGGCGVVYVAEQTEPVRRSVALKIIKLGMDTRQVVARFEAERQALAMMDHPNIAKVLDGGSTETGRPYFVMELVRGIRITDYCDQNRLPTVARLDLFIQVCHAIQHAHQKGIIHRDIKPSNILVTLHDGVPVPKVIDFGIAKATEGRLTDVTVYTQLNHFIGTPAYVSPEQAEMSGLDIDTRSDIYSLGVLLYELLTGSTPFKTNELRSQGLEAMVKMIREKEPPRPSNRLAALKGEELTTTVERRATEAPKLISLLRGDLDWIVMKCLEKDRTRRYETANGLAQDIERHLKHEPVLARPPSRVYRLRKSIRRNRVAYAAAAAVVGALALGIAFSTWQAVRATRAEKVADQRLVESEKARKESEAITKFLTGVFQSPNPARDGRTITVAETLDKAVTNLDRDMGDQPALRARLEATLGYTYYALGLYLEAIPLQERVLDYYRTTAGPEHPDTLTAIHNLATTYHYVGAGNYPAIGQANQLAREAVRLRRKVLGPEHPDTLASMLLLANRTPSRTESYNLRAEVLRVRREALGPEHPDTIMAVNYLVFSHRDLGRLDEALKLWEELLRLSRNVLGTGHPATLMIMHNLADGYLAAGRNQEALGLLEELLPIRHKMLGPEHPDTILAMQSLGNCYGACGRWEEAFALLEGALALRRKNFGPEHPDTLSLVANLRQACFAAWQGYRDAGIGLSQQTLGFSNTVFALKLAALQVWFGRETGYAETCRQILQLAADPQDPLVATCSAKMAHLRPSADPQLRPMALALARRAVELGQTHPARLWLQMDQGIAEYRNGNYAEADRMLSAAALASPTLEKRYEAQVKPTSKFYGAMSLFRQGKASEAQLLFDEAEAFMQPLPADIQWPLSARVNHDDLILWLAFKEAKALLASSQTSSP